MTDNPQTTLATPSRHQWLAAAIVIVGITSLVADARAGRPCEARQMSVTEIRKGLEMAAHTAAELDRYRVTAGIIARVGQDLSRWQQRYSHIGLVYRHAGQPWRIVHKLNDCGSDRAHVYRQGLAEFFTDAPHDWEAAVVPLRARAAGQLLDLLGRRAAITRLHEPRYSMVANPWATRYQQSNQWALETLSMAVEPQIKARGQAQNWLRYRDYRPQRLRLGTFTRLGARITRANVEFDDHPAHLRFTGRIDTTTADSALSWLERSGLGERRFVVRLRDYRFNRHTSPRRTVQPVTPSDRENFWR